MALQNKCDMLMLLQQLIPLLICELGGICYLTKDYITYSYFVNSFKTFKEVHLTEALCMCV